MSTGPTVLMVGQNLVFMPRVQAAAQAVGCEVRLARSVEAFHEACERSEPALVLFDLEGDVDTWTGVLESLGKSGKSGVRLVAFGPHEDVAGMERARSLGCDPVVTKGEFSRDLPRVIEMARSAPAS
jgi:AmiR/NasT family two-component response regulator